MSPYARALRRWRVANVALAIVTTWTVMIAIVVGFMRIQGDPRSTPLAWWLVVAFAVFILVALVSVWTAQGLEKVNYEIEGARRRAVRAGLYGDYTLADQEWASFYQLSGATPPSSKRSV